MCVHQARMHPCCTAALYYKMYSSCLPTPCLWPSHLCNCYLKCSAALGASSWRIYMTQVFGLWSVHVHIYSVYIHTHTQMVQPTRNRSDVSHLMSTPLTSHTSDFHTHTHTLIRSHTCPSCLDQCKPGWSYDPAPLFEAWLTSSDSDFDLVNWKWQKCPFQLNIFSFLALTTSISALLFWENASHFLRMLSLFSNTTAALSAKVKGRIPTFSGVHW